MACLVLMGPLYIQGDTVAREPGTVRDDPAVGAPSIETPAASPGGDEIPITRWVSPDGRRPTSFAEWQARQPALTRLLLSQRYRSARKPLVSDQLVHVLVNPSIYDGIASSLAQWASDAEDAGWSVGIFSASFPDPPSLRSYLAGAASLGGCLLIGDFPVPWYELDAPEHEEFPVDLYYMDLDGLWMDGDLDGLYDAHLGNVAPEIWVGRLTAGNLELGGADEVTLLNNYFAKNHGYRTGDLLLPSRALMYVDDDWEPWAEYWGLNLALAYGDTTVISEPETTTAWDYGGRLEDNYEWIQVCAHSWPLGHGFVYNGGQNWSWLYNYELYDIDPHAFFYNLFACSAARYVETDYIGGWYVFVDTYGLAAVGSTKTGSMLGFEEFYGPLGQEASLGQAFRIWFEEVGIYDQYWHYGMTLLGDPTLTTARWPRLAVSPTWYDETVEWGETTTRTLTIINSGLATLEFEIDEVPPTGVPWLSEMPPTGTVPANSMASVAITFAASQVAEPGVYQAGLQITSNDPLLPTTTLPLTMTVNPPVLVLTKGDGPDPVEAGGRLTYTLVLENLSPGAVTAVAITDTIPAATAFAWAGGDGHLVDGQVLWTDQTVDGGGSLTATFAVTTSAPLTDGTVISNTHYGVTCAQGVRVQGEPVTTTVRSSPLLTITKSGSPDPVGVGALLTYTLVLRNSGNAHATGVTITDTIPEYTTFARADGGGILADGQVRWSGMALNASHSLTVTLAVTVGAPLAGGAVITNPGYGATCTQGVSAVGSPIITVVQPQIYNLFLPLVFKATSR
jgi:uncharacterized repeat protein (TIGR01451 family)